MEERDRSSGWIGTVLHGKWHIDAKVARGGVATVFRATHRQGQVAAIKIMHPEYSRNEDVRRRFLLEGYAANKVGHPGVVRVLDDDVTAEGSAYIVMELLQNGEDLEVRRLARGGRLPVAEVAQICDQVLDVLAAAHEKGIVHRDIKPDNIFVLADDTVKVLDFGIAHIKQAVVKHEPTATGLLLGTPDYMSPEQAVGARGHIDAQTDLYALGATMFTLLSGETVHLSDTLSMLLVATGSRQARSLASVAFKDLPREIIAFVDKALALEKARRWPTARAMQAALRAAVPGSGSARQRSAVGVEVPAPPPATVTVQVAVPALPAPRPPPPRRPSGGKLLDVSPLSSPTALDVPLHELDEGPTQTKLVPADPWTDEFADGDMEGPTVATAGSGRSPVAGLPPKVITKPPLPMSPPDREITKSMPHDFAPRPSAPPPPPPPASPPAFVAAVPSYPPPPPAQPVIAPPIAPPWVAPPADPRPLVPARPPVPVIAIAAIGFLAFVIVSILIGAVLWLRAR